MNLDEEEDLFSDPRRLNKLFKMGWNSFVIIDQRNKSINFCSYIEGGYCYTLPIQLIFAALGVDDFFKNAEELEKALVQKEDLKEINPQELLNKIISSYSLHNVIFEIEGNSNLYADEAFTSVIDNIISNAINHGKADKIKISLKSSKGTSIIRIVDNGSGILNENKNSVFERSFKHGKTTGTGLGLYIVKKVIDRYGGEITLQDNFAKGTIFEIKLKNREGEVI